MKYGKFLGISGHIEIMFSHLTFIVDFIMNLISGLYHEYEKREHYFSCFKST